MRAAWILLVAGCGFQSPLATTDGTPGGDGTPTTPDAGFDYALCPASYNVTTLPGPSRYRFIKDGHRAWEQSDACNKDAPAATHLVVIETTQEFAAISAFIKPGPGTAGDSLWIGAVQPVTATTPRDGWLGFDGAPLFDGWGGSEPNDNNDNDESDHEEQFVRMTRTQPPYFIDDGGSKSFGALCECDGKPIDPTVAAMVASYGLPP